MFILLAEHCDKSLYNIISWAPHWLLGSVTMPHPGTTRLDLVSVSFYNQLYREESTQAWSLSPLTLDMCAKVSVLDLK